MSYIPRFIRLYADPKTASTIKSDPAVLEQAFGKSLEELALLPGFSAQQKLVESLRQEIQDDDARYNTTNAVQQIVECLKTVMRVAINGGSDPSVVVLKIRTLRRLFLRIYSRSGTKWTKAQIRHVWFVSELFAAWHTYFLSYTNSGATIVNDDYKSVIDKWADPKIRKSRNPDEDNILVDAMINWFTRKKMGYRTFYDKKAIEAGDYLEEAIAPAIKNTLSFVQLIQLETFKSEEGKINWSYAEYDLFTRCTERMLEAREQYRTVLETRFIPVLAGDPEDLTFEDDQLPKEFRPWKKRIFDKTHYVRLPTDKQEFDTAMKALQAAIVRRGYRIIESVPA